VRFFVGTKKEILNILQGSFTFLVDKRNDKWSFKLSHTHKWNTDHGIRRNFQYILSSWVWASELGTIYSIISFKKKLF